MPVHQSLTREKAATTQSWLIIAGTIATALGIALALAPRAMRHGLTLQALGIATTGIGGVWVLTSGSSVGASFSNELAPAAGVDALSGLFLAVIAIVAAPALIYARGYLSDGGAHAAHAAGAHGAPTASPHAGAIAAVSGTFVLALVGVVVARDALSFLVMWELMSIAPAATILLTSRTRSVCHAVLVYLGLTHLAGVGVWLAMLTLAHLGAFGNPEVLAGESGLLRSLLAAAVLIGFGTKAGLIPLHTWLPRAHPVAPSHISALMSGVMVKVALYGLVRMLFQWLGPLPGWVAPTLLAAAALSCLAGALYALVQRDLKVLLAFSTVENVGIITLGLAAALLAADAGHTTIAAIAFAAAMLHLLNHALFKSLLFLCAGSFERQVGKLDLDRLGGLLRVMPITGAAFLIGALAIAGVPPLNGFASEWLTLQALVQLALSSSLGGGDVMTTLFGALGATALAATAALAVYCFVNVIGLVLLGAHRQKPVAEARESVGTMTAPLVCLAAFCIAIGVVPGVVLSQLEQLSPYGSLPTTITATTVALPGSGNFAPLAVFALLVVIVGALQLARRRGGSTAPSPMWITGQTPHSRLAWTSAGFTKSLRLVLESMLRPQRSLVIDRDGPIVRAVRHQSEVPHLFDDLLYQPILRASLAASRVLRRTQSGNLRAYLAYLLATLIIVLAVVRLGAS